MRYLILLVAVLFLPSCEGPQERVFPKISSLTESVYASATIQPDSLYKVYAAVGGILDQNLVEEGDLVQPGTPLMQIINNTPKLNADNAKLALQLAEENYSGSAALLKDLEEQIQSASLNFRNDSINFFRQKRLWDQQIGSKKELDNRQLAYQLSLNNRNMLKSRYARTKNELKTQLQQASNNYKAATINSKDFTVRSKLNGKVYALFKEPGEVVSILEPLAAVGSASVFVIEMLVDEMDIVKLTLGQKALISLDAYPSQVFTATVTKIYPRKDERSQTFTVEATFNDPPKTLYPGLAGEANIIIAEKKNALTIPKTYLFEGNKVRTADEVVEVTLGLQNLERVEILKGIDEETELIKPE
ncbi:MAG: efflux RND transporter periplasmic adaptor subunit [Arenibacter sp.]|nr:efflux RND transporter periplasmic adaptor subunit [Arenibacter sp.]